MTDALVPSARRGTKASSDLEPLSELSGTQKAALVLMNMSTDRASAVLKTLSLEEQEEITAEMARVRRISGAEAELAIQAFREVALRAEDRGERTGRDVATELIEVSFEGERAADL